MRTENVTRVEMDIFPSVGKLSDACTDSPLWISYTQLIQLLLQ